MSLENAVVDEIFKQTGEPFKRRIRFRDKLRNDLALRQQYEILKQQLAKNHPHDREAYTAAKSELISSVINTYHKS